MTVKAAVLAAGLSYPDRLFPDYFTPPSIDEQEDAAQEGDDVVYDYSDVTWEMPDEDGLAETMRLLSSMGAHTTMSLSDDDEFVPQPPPGAENMAAPDDDREWL